MQQNNAFATGWNGVNVGPPSLGVPLGADDPWSCCCCGIIWCCCWGEALGGCAFGTGGGPIARDAGPSPAMQQNNAFATGWNGVNVGPPSLGVPLGADDPWEREFARDRELKD
jgi:hypothetical protein